MEPILSIKGEILDLDEFSCGICLGVMSNPTMSTNCGHSFCRECIETNLKTTKSCPVCKLGIDGLVPNIMLKNIINKLATSTCPQCQWTGGLEHYETHHKSCPSRESKCPFNECSGVVKLKDLEEHKAKCPFRTVLCEYCNLETKVTELTDHYPQCISYPIECDYCHLQVNKNKMEEHILESCIYKRCNFNNCKTRLFQEELEAHRLVCNKRPYNCDYCGKEVVYKHLNSHFKKCYKHPVDCHLCHVHIPQRDMLKLHISNDCPEKPVICKYHPIGCYYRCGRKDMVEHMEELDPFHVKLLKDWFDGTEFKKMVPKVNKAKKKKKHKYISKFKIDSNDHERYYINDMSRFQQIKGKYFSELEFEIADGSNACAVIDIISPYPGVWDTGGLSYTYMRIETGERIAVKKGDVIRVQKIVRDGGKN